MWPAAPPTSAPLMQPLASAVEVCAVNRNAAAAAANTNFMRISLTQTIAQRDPPERGSDYTMADELEARADERESAGLTDAVLLGLKPIPFLQDALSRVRDIPPSLSS
jgi:hypothetical protein